MSQISFRLVFRTGNAVVNSKGSVSQMIHKPPSAGFGKRHLHTVDGQNPPTSWDC